VARTAAVAIALILALGGFIFYNTNILNAYRTIDEAGLQQAEYERRYQRYEDAPQPIIVDAELRVEIYPEQPAVDLRGTYRLINRSGAAIDSVHVYTDPKVEVRSISFNRGARPEVINAKRKIRVAKGSGTTVQEINKLLKMHQEMSTAMKRLKKMGGLGKLAAMFNKGGLEGALGGLAPPGALPPGGLPGLGGGGPALPGLGGSAPFNLPPGFDKFSKK
jgi:hypothetical protein